VGNDMKKDTDSSNIRKDGINTSNLNEEEKSFEEDYQDLKLRLKPEKRDKLSS
jgi:hypothetical protein